MLKIQNLSFTVLENGKKKTILDNINIIVNDGESIVITGHNGSGKSTLVKLIMGINKPSTGRIYFNDTDITDMTIDQRANLGICFAFQQPVRFKGLKVRDLFEIATGEKIKTSASCDFLSKVGLCARDYLDRELNSTLSGGELKRIEIALAFARKGQLGIFDEPEAGIDIWSFKTLVSCFENYKNSNKNSSFIIVSHQEKMMELADKILVLDNGKVKSFASKKEVLPSLKGIKVCGKLGEGV